MQSVIELVQGYLTLRPAGAKSFAFNRLIRSLWAAAVQARPPTRHFTSITSVSWLHSTVKSTVRFRGGSAIRPRGPAERIRDLTYASGHWVFDCFKFTYGRMDGGEQLDLVSN
jgi:hypothetical protein